MGRGDTWTNAIIGAVVTILTSFTGVAPFLGGIVAGYLNKRDGPKVGALSGAIAVLPLVGIVFLAGSVFAFVPFVHSGMGPGMGGTMAVGGVFVFVGVVFLLAYAVGLGALGGYMGQYLHDEDVV